MFFRGGVQTSLIANAIEDETTAVLMGDVNSDGKLDIRDAALIAKKITQGKENELPESADFNRDGIANIRYAALIERYIMTKGEYLSPDYTLNESLGNEELSLSSSYGYPGETVTLEVNVKCNNNLESFNAVLNWDDVALTAVDVEGNNGMISSESGDGYSTIVVYSYEEIADGSIAAIDFTIPADAEPGTVYNIDFSNIGTFAVFDGPDISDLVDSTGGTITVIGVDTPPDNPDYNETPTLSLSSVSGMPGETVTVAVQATTGDQLQGADLKIDYNSDLTPASELYGRYVFTSENTGDTAWAVILSSTNPIPDGDIAYIDFIIPADAEPGTVYDVGFSTINAFALLDGSDIYDSVMAVGGTITVLDDSEQPDDNSSIKIYDDLNLKYKIINGDEDYIEITDHYVSMTGNNITDLVIPNEIEGLPVKSIGDRAFSGIGLESIFINDNITSIGESPFLSSVSLESINVSEGNKNFCSVDGVLFSKDKTTLIAYPLGKNESEYTIPDGVKVINKHAFYLNSNLKTVIIPDSVTSIGVLALWGCNINVAEENKSFCSIDGILFNKDKTEIICYPSKKMDSEYKIPNGVKTIGELAFTDCQNLENIIIPEGVETIGEYAFSFCDFKNIELPSSVKSIGKGLFDYTSIVKLTVLNPECEFPEELIDMGLDVIYGYENSTAQAYAEKYGYKFRLIGDEPNGDANGDGKVNVRDAAEIARKIAQGKKDELPDSADYNKDGKVNVRDAAAIARDLARGII